MDALKKKAITLAAAYYINTSGDLFDAYEELERCVEKGLEPASFRPCEGFENASLLALLEHIDGAAEANLVAFKDVLNAAKEGIVKSAIDGSLDSDMNNLDMEDMCEIGSMECAA